MGRWEGGRIAKKGLGAGDARLAEAARVRVTRWAAAAAQALTAPFTPWRPAFAAALLCPCPPIGAAEQAGVRRATEAAVRTKFNVVPLARTADRANAVAHCPALLPARLAARGFPNAAVVGLDPAEVRCQDLRDCVVPHLHHSCHEL